MPTSNSEPQTAEHLRQIALFKDLDEYQLAVVWRAVSRRSTETKQIIPATDGLSEHVCFVWSGEYRVVVHAPPPGPQLSIRTVRAGGHFGEVPTFSAMPDLQYHLAVDQGGLLLMVPRETFVTMVHSMKSMCEGVLRSLAQAAVLRADRLFEFATMDVRLRLLAEIVRLARAAAPSQNTLALESPTHAALAAQVGTTREGVGRHLRALEREGLLQWKRGQIEILNLQEMRRLVLSAAGPRPTYIFDSTDKAH